MAGLLSFLKYPIAGAMIAGGALGVAHVFGPQIADELGKDAGVSFAEGVADFQARVQRLAESAPAVAGGRGMRRRGVYR